MTTRSVLRGFGMAALSGAMATQPLAARAAATCARIVQSGPVSDPQVKSMVKSLLMSYLVTVNPDMAKGLADSDVDVSQAFQQAGWIVYLVAAPAVDLDPGFVFVNQLAVTGQQPYVWSGSATADERADIDAEIRKNNKGIGADLAACIVGTIVGDAN